jgi:hypothetical protein
MNLSDIASVTDLRRTRERIVGIDRCVPLLDGSLQPYVNLDRFQDRHRPEGVAGFLGHLT